MKSEAEKLPIDQIKQRIRSLETQTNSWKSEINRLRKEMSKE